MQTRGRTNRRVGWRNDWLLEGCRGTAHSFAHPPIPSHHGLGQTHLGLTLILSAVSLPFLHAHCLLACSPSKSALPLLNPFRLPPTSRISLRLHFHSLFLLSSSQPQVLNSNFIAPHKPALSSFPFRPLDVIDGLATVRSVRVTIFNKI